MIERKNKRRERKRRIMAEEEKVEEELGKNRSCGGRMIVVMEDRERRGME